LLICWFPEKHANKN